MKCFVAVLGLLAVASANPGAEFATYSYANPAGVTYRGTGFNPNFSIGPAQPVGPYAAAAVGPAPVQYAAAAPQVQYAAAPQLQYAAAPQLQYAAAPQVHYAHAPAVAVTQKVGYAHHQVPVQVPGVADVPVTKLALTQGVTQKLVDVAQPAVTNRRVKVRRPALRKEFYDIEHRVIVRPAGSATLELSQPISKEQKGPAVLTPTNYQQIAPVVRYGNSRQIIDGQGVSEAAQIRANLARGIQAGPAPAPQPQLRAAPQPQPQLRAAPQPQPQLRAAPQPQPQPQPQQYQEQPQQQPQQYQAQPQQQPQQYQAQPQQQPQQYQAQPQQQPQQYQAQPQQQPQQYQAQPQQQPQQYQAQPQPQAAPAPRLRPLQLRPQGPPQPQLRSADAEIIDSGAGPGPAPQPQQPQPQEQQLQAQGARLALPEMPVEIQARLLELLSAKGGTVTEVLGENGRPNSASVLQVADALQDVNLQGGERITTRRIVVTRPIETIQEVDIQEPATKIHRHLVNTPTLFKTAVQGVARVPVSVPGVKNVATPVLQTTYAQAAPQLQYSQYAAPQYAY